MNTKDPFLEAITEALEPLVDKAFRKALLELRELETDDICILQDACEITHLTEATIYVQCSKKYRARYPDKNLIPFHKRPGSGRLYFSRKELRNWMFDGDNGE